MVGCIIKTKFVTPNSDIFGGYIDYIDRENAVRNEHISSYSIYTNYMGNPEKTTDIFTDSSNHLSPEEKEQLKNTYIKAQKNGSLMWQTVISFDNRWLEENGLWDSKTHMLDKNKLMNYCRSSVNSMLKAENLENAVWSAAIHYNTDNIHIHIATVEPTPTRRKMIVDGKEEFRGKFKLSSIEACKSRMVNQIVEHSLENQKINEIMRESIINSIRDDVLLENKDIVTQYLSVYNKLPSDKRAWKYGMNKIAVLRPEIDIITSLYIQKYHGEEYKQLKELLANQNGIYSEAYGGKTNAEYIDNKIKDLYKRCGNRILASMKNLAFSDLKEEESSSYIEAEINEAEQTDEPLDFDGKIETEKSAGKRKIHILSKKWWSKDYKSIKVLLSEALTYEEADEKLTALSDIEAKYIEQSDAGNCVASFELGRMYDNGTFGDVDNAKAQEYYGIALKGFIAAYPEAQGDAWMQDYVNYKIGRMYIDGKGCKPDIRSGIEYLKKSGSPFASYTLGCLYYKGNGTEADPQKAYDYFFRAAEPGGNYKSMPFAEYNMAQMLEKGIVEDDSHEADDLYRSALNSFKASEKHDPNDLNEYRIAVMLLDGKGCDCNPEEAETYLKASAEFGNTYAQTKLAQLYLSGENPEKAEEAIQLLIKASEAENVTARYQLGKIYTDKESKYFNAEKGLKLLESAAEQGNGFAIHQLGKIYCDGEIAEKDMNRAIEYFKSASELNNEFSQFRLGSIYMQDEYKNISKAIDEFTKSAEQGNQFAQYQLGKIYTEKGSDYFNTEKGLKLLESAAEQSNSFALHQLGKIYCDGEITKKDMNRAIEYFTKASELNNEFAQYHLGSIYMSEEYKDIPKAIDEFTKSAEQGNQFAQYQLGNIYLSGDVTEQDIDLAIRYLNEAAEQGNGFAQYRLGSIYFYDELGHKNIYQALNCFTAAAEQGNQFAQYQLGLVYLKGDEIAQNPDLAIRYFGESAEQGNQFAQYQLGNIYLKGEITEKNEREAVRYFEQSAEQGNQFAQYQLGKLFLFGSNEIAADRIRATEYLRASAAQGNEYAEALLNWRPQRSNYVAQKTFDDSLMLLSDNMRMLFSRLADEHAHMLNQQVYRQLEQTKKKEEKGQEK